jgi:hypothetical protein
MRTEYAFQIEYLIQGSLRQPVRYRMHFHPWEEEEEEEEELQPTTWQDALPKGAQVLTKPADLSRKNLLKKRILLQGEKGRGWFCGKIKTVHNATKGKVTLSFPAFNQWQTLSLSLYTTKSSAPGSWVLFKPQPLQETYKGRKGRLLKTRRASTSESSVIPAVPEEKNPTGREQRRTRGKKRSEDEDVLDTTAIDDDPPPRDSDREPIRKETGAPAQKPKKKTAKKKPTQSSRERSPTKKKKRVVVQKPEEDSDPEDREQENEYEDVQKDRDMYDDWGNPINEYGEWI